MGDDSTFLNSVEYVGREMVVGEGVWGQNTAEAKGCEHCVEALRALAVCVAGRDVGVGWLWRAERVRKPWFR